MSFMPERRQPANATLRSRVDQLLRLQQEMHALSEDLKHQTLVTVRTHAQADDKAQSCRRLFNVAQLQKLRQLIRDIERQEQGKPDAQLLTTEEMTALLGPSPWPAQPLLPTPLRKK